MHLITQNIMYIFVAYVKILEGSWLFDIKYSNLKWIIDQQIFFDPHIET